MSSPYFEDYVEEPEEPTIPERIKAMFPTRQNHLASIYKVYKTCFNNFKTQSAWMGSGENLLEELLNTKISLNIDAQASVDMAKNAIFQQEIVTASVGSIPIFLDFAYLYYVHRYDDKAPIYKLPAKLSKYDLFANALECPKDELYECFKQCIENEFISELRIETPPYMLRTELDINQIQKKIITEVEPLCKKILTLITLDGSAAGTSLDRITDKPSNSPDHSERSSADGCTADCSSGK